MLHTSESTESVSNTAPSDQGNQCTIHSPARSVLELQTISISPCLKKNSKADRDLINLFCDENKENRDPLARLRVPLSKKKTESALLRKHNKRTRHKKCINTENLLLEPLLAVVSELRNNSQNIIQRRSIMRSDGNSLRTPFAELSKSFHRMI